MTSLFMGSFSTKVHIFWNEIQDFFKIHITDENTLVCHLLPSHFMTSNISIYLNSVIPDVEVDKISTNNSRNKWQKSQSNLYICFKSMGTCFEPYRSIFSQLESLTCEINKNINISKRIKKIWVNDMFVKYNQKFKQILTI